MLTVIALLAGCSTRTNTAGSRFWHSFNSRYNTYYNGSLAFIDGAEAKENGNKDNFTELLPLYTIGNKQSRQLGASNFDRAIEKSQKVIKIHSIKARPKWHGNSRKTPKDLEWLNRREYNPFIWKAWLLMGKSQFQKGELEEAAATFSYMSRLYATQPAINGIARAWLAKTYAELDWLYDAEDVITKMGRDSMHYRAVTDWDYAYCNYYLHTKDYQKAIDYLRKVIKHEKRHKQKAREWYLMGQLHTIMGNKREAFNAYSHVMRLSPPYELKFNSRIAQTEVMAAGQSKKMIRRLRRMTHNDNNKEYLDQVYYAIGNIYLAERDTANAIAAYEKGNKESTRNGIEKGVLLLKLGDIYWTKEKYNDAQRCYGEAIGLLDKDRDDYEQLSRRSRILDELVPFTDAVYLQDSLQELAVMPEAERLAAIDRVIDALKKKEKEEKRAAAIAESEQMQQKQAAVGNRQQSAAPGTVTQGNGQWYFYNPQAVSQGKAAFQRQWGKRENADNWQRINQTVVASLDLPDSSSEELSDSIDADSIGAGLLTENGEAIADTTATDFAIKDSLANDPHNREYYLAQIPFTEEAKAASDAIIMDGLYNSGVIFKDKLENLSLSEKALVRLTTQYPDYEKNDMAYYHLYLLYSRQQRSERADSCLAALSERYPESEYSILLNDPYFVENAKFGVHIEDSLYAATYEAFKAGRHDEVKANAAVSSTRFKLGANRAKFIFIEGLSLLNDGDADGCVSSLQQVVSDYPTSEVAELAGMIIRGVQQGRRLYGGTFDLSDIWSRRDISAAGQDSTSADTLVVERNTNFIFMLAYMPDSVNQNQMLYELAKYNFTNFLVRRFDIEIDNDNGISRMMVSGFLNYDEALQYARQLYANPAMAEMLKPCHRIIISEKNLPLLGTRVSYREYEEFFDRMLAPMEVSPEQLLTKPETIVTEPEPEAPEQEEESDDDDGFMPSDNNDNGNADPGGFDFDEDFYR